MTATYMDYLADLYEAQAEHAAYKECIEFDGDVCHTCTQFEMEQFRVLQNAKHARVLNRSYQRLLALIEEPLTVGLLTGVMDRAVLHAEIVVGQGGRTCGKCAGSGTFSLKNERTAETGETTKAVCYACAGKGRMTDADRRRNDVYWALYARVSA